MAIAPLSLSIGSFSGDGQGQSPWTLPSVYSPSGSVNLYINRLGEIRTIDGYSKQNAAAFLTDTGGSPALIRSLFQFRKIISPVATVAVLVVAGGGSGGSNDGGGGGAGGIVDNAAFAVTPGVKTVTVGNGGAASVGPNAGATGQNSVFDSITAHGGGGGGGAAGAAKNGLAGGSGGGGSWNTGAGAAATDAIGHAGGNGVVGADGAAGGGGGGSAAGANGNAGGLIGGAGGAGYASSISGASVTYGGGGGGAAATPGAGGVGGGGLGGSNSVAAVDGTPNTGGGGGGWKNVVGGGAGGSGVVIVSYPTGRLSAVGGVMTTVGSMTIHTFTASGTFTVTGLAPTALRQILFAMDDGVDEFELHYSSDLGVTQTFIIDFGAGSVGSIPDYAASGDQLFITNGVVTPRMWDGTSLVVAGATQLAAPGLTDIAAGVLIGSYQARVVPILPNKQRKPGSIASLSIQLQNRSLKIDWVADADVTVVGYEVYRTTGTGQDYYLDSYVDGRLTITYTTNLPDTTLLTKTALALVASFGDPPPSGAYFCVSHKSRVFWLRTDAFPRRVWWSDPGDPDSVYQDRSFTDCTDAVSLGDSLSGGTGEFNGMLVVWLTQSIWTISGTGQLINGVIDWRKRRTNATTGAVHVRATLAIPAGSLYPDQDGSVKATEGGLLAFLSPLFDIRLFDGDTSTIISFQKKDTLARINPSMAYKSYAYIDPTHGMAVWVVPLDSSLEPDYSIAWNYWFGTWHEWSGTNFAHVVSGVESATQKNLVIAGEAHFQTGAFLYQLWSGVSQAGDPITATLMTKAIYPPAEQSIGLSGAPDLSLEKRLESIFLLFTKDASPTTLTVGFLPPDAADGDTPTITRTVSGSSRVRVPARMTQSLTNPGKYFTNTGWRLKISSTGSTGPWVLQAIQHLYQLLTGQTR